MAAVEAADVPLPDSPNESLVELPAQPDTAVEVGWSDAPAPTLLNAEPSAEDAKPEEAASTVNAMLQSPARKGHTLTQSKPMSPEKAALAAMFDSIKMPAPLSPTKSPRKASGGSNILSSPSKHLAGEAASTASSLFRKPSSPVSSPSKIGSTDSASSRPYSRDSPLRRPVVLSSSSPGRGLLVSQAETKNASTPLSPAPTASSADSRPPRMRPSMLASSSSPSARLSDLSLVLDTTGTQELLFNQDASFLAATNTAADVTIDDSFDISRAKARIQSASTSSSSTRRSSPAKLGAIRAKARCSTVPEDDVPETEPSTHARGNALGLRGLGVGRVVKNAAGDDTIELNLTGSFIGNSSMIGGCGNLMDESGEASLLFGNSFSISGAQEGDGKAQASAAQKVRRGSSDDDDEDEEEEDYERDAANMQKWAAEAARKAQLGRPSVDKTPSRPVAAARTGTSTVTRPSAGASTGVKPVSRVAPRRSLVTPTAGSRLLQSRGSAKPEAVVPRSGSASAGLSSLAMPTPTPTAPSEAAKVGNELKTPMRSRRKSTFTSSRPPVSGPARRRESLAAAAIIQAHPIPALPSLAPATPGRTRTASAPSVGGSPLKTPTAAATRAIPKPRASLTGRTSGVLPTPRAGVSAAGSASAIGSIPRPRASLTSAATPGVSSRATLSSSAVSTRTPGARVPTARSASLATPTARTATSRASSVEATPVSGMRKSASQPHGLDAALETPTATSAAVPRARTLVPRASMSGISATPSSAARPSSLTTPRPTSGAVRAGNSASITQNTGEATKIGVPATTRPSLTGRTVGGGFGYKPRTSAVYVGPTRATSLLQDHEDKEN